MIYFQRQFILDMLKIFDLFLIMVCLIVSASITNYSDDLLKTTYIFALRFSVKNLLILVGFASIWHLIFTSLGFYNSKRISSYKKEAWDIIKGTSAVVIVLLLAQIVHPMEIINKQTLAIFWPLCTGVFMVCRAGMRFYFRVACVHHINLKKILIVGTNARAIAMAEKILKHPFYGYVIEGFVDNQWHGPQQENSDRYKIVSDLTNFKVYIREHIIDEVFIMLPIKSNYDEIESIVRTCEEQGIIIRMQTDFMDLRIAQLQVEFVAEIPLLTLYTGTKRHKANAAILKDVFDFGLAAGLLFLLLPLLVVLATAIKLTSPGPVFFRQERISYNKRKFRIYKFRTMAVDAESRLKDLEHLNEMGTDAGAFKLKNDPRITPLGKILRKLSLDELPQLINVLQGDMSIVGPRPLTIRDYEKFSIDWQRRRFSVKPGITCLWQISGRNNISFERWMELDMEYIDNWSLSLDFKILVNTIPAVVFGKGAQ